MIERYFTIKQDSEAEIVIKRSRFRCWVRRVSSEEEARLVVEQARKDYWDARHHCFAFVLANDGAISRSSDDGEPAGTAGMPILDVLKGRELTEVVAVVTRWFGGTLLGTGGLVKAYSQATAAALDKAGIRQRKLVKEYELLLDHADAGKIESELHLRGITVLDREYGAQVGLRLAISSEDIVAAQQSVAELTSGLGNLTYLADRWVG